MSDWGGRLSELRGRAGLVVLPEFVAPVPGVAMAPAAKIGVVLEEGVGTREEELMCGVRREAWPWVCPRTTGEA